MYVESPSRTYRAKDGSTRTYRTHLLRRSFRDGGKVKKETLANLSALPDSALAALKASLSGSVLVDAGDMFEIERSLPHGHVAAAHVMASRLGLKDLLGPDCPERDLAYGLIIARAVAPASKLATTRWWADTTLGTQGWGQSKCLGLQVSCCDPVSFPRAGYRPRRASAWSPVRSQPRSRRAAAWLG